MPVPASLLLQRQRPAVLTGNFQQLLGGLESPSHRQSWQPFLNLISLIFPTLFSYLQSACQGLACPLEIQALQGFRTWTTSEPPAGGGRQEVAGLEAWPALFRGSGLKTSGSDPRLPFLSLPSLLLRGTTSAQAPTAPHSSTWPVIAGWEDCFLSQFPRLHFDCIKDCISAAASSLQNYHTSKPARDVVPLGNFFLQICSTRDCSWLAPWGLRSSKNFPTVTLLRIWTWILMLVEQTLHQPSHLSNAL